jgi:uncharacterized protein (TIGR02596 family)
MARHGARSAFTITELIVVMAIIAIIVAISAPIVTRSLGATRVTTAGDSLQGLLEAARQHAIAHNSVAEVRFYRYPLPGSTRPTINAIRVLRYHDEIQTDPDTLETFLAEPLLETFYLPESLTITTEETLSSLFSQTRRSWEKESSTSGGDEGFLQQRHIFEPNSSEDPEYMLLRFLPDGGTDLLQQATGPGKIWHLTVLSLRDEEILEGSSEIPTNYVTLQLDPFSGTSRLYRP